MFSWHTGKHGGLKYRTALDTLKYRPERIMQNAVNGMLPKNRTRKVRMDRLKVYAGEEHPHVYNKPEVWNIINSTKPDLTAAWGYQEEYYVDIVHTSMFLVVFVDFRT